MKPTHVLVVGALLAFCVVMVPGLSNAFGAAPTQTDSVTDEPLTLELNDTVFVDNAGRAERISNFKLTLNNSTVDSTEYHWRYNGSVVTNNESIAGKDTNASYDYEFKRAPTQTGESVLRIVFLVVAALTVVAGGGVVLAMLGLFSSPGGGR